jgi:EXPERA (EXPanded EBP superfamily)
MDPLPASRWRSLFRDRPADAALFVVCIVFTVTTFVPDVTAVLGIDLVHFDETRAHPPAWPPLFVLEALVRYGRACDRLFLYNPPWFRAVMFGDVFVLGTYYVAAAYALVTGARWLRIPTFIYASHVLTVAPLLVVEHLWGPYASPAPGLVLAAYAPYWILPFVMLWRVRRA